MSDPVGDHMALKDQSPMNSHTAAFFDARARMEILEDILEERGRQEALVRDGDLPFTCADTRVSWLRKLPILVEEVGEVSEELQRPTPDRERLYAELIQVAAVAVAWAESVKEGK